MPTEQEVARQAAPLLAVLHRRRLERLAREAAEAKREVAA